MMAFIRLPIVADAAQDWIPATVVGGLLIVFGLWLITTHWKAWKRDSIDQSIDENERRHLRHRFRRRMQASVIMVLIGILVPLGDWGIAWDEDDPMIWTVFWLMVLGLTTWMLLLAVADFTATRSHSRVTMSQIKLKQEALQAEADRLRAEARGTNGRD